MSYIIRCSVSGGVTGYRESIVQDYGQIMRFDSKETAETKATELTNRTNNPFSRATFRYWIAEE